jgi:hypothetical protein
MVKVEKIQQTEINWGIQLPVFVGFRTDPGVC